MTVTDKEKDLPMRGGGGGGRGGWGVGVNFPTKQTSKKPTQIRVKTQIMTRSKVR